MDAFGQLGIGDRAGDDVDTLESPGVGDAAHPLAQVGARLDSDQAPSPVAVHPELVQDEAEVGLACAEVDEHGVVVPFERVVECRRDEASEVRDLLDLAVRRRARTTAGRHEPEGLQQLDRLAVEQGVAHFVGLESGAFGAGAHASNGDHAPRTGGIAVTPMRCR